MKRRLKINGLIMAVAFFLLAGFPRLFLRQERTDYLEVIAEIFGVALIILGQIFRASARGYKAENSGNGQELIQGGPYTLVRNPMYLGILLIGTGIVLMLFNWLVAGIFLLVFIVRYLLLIFKEEKKLNLAFSRQYQDYCRKVPRLLPALSMLSGAEISRYLPLKPLWLKKEIGSMLAVLLVTLLVESGVDIKDSGLRVYVGEALPLAVTLALFIGLIIYLLSRTADFRKDATAKS